MATVLCPSRCLSPGGLVVYLSYTMVEGPLRKGQALVSESDYSWEIRAPWDWLQQGHPTKGWNECVSVHPWMKLLLPYFECLLEYSSNAKLMGSNSMETHTNKRNWMHFWSFWISVCKMHKCQKRNVSSVSVAAL